MDKAKNLTSVRPSDLLYKGRRVFIPANSMADHPDIVSAVHPNAKIIAGMVQSHQLSFIPDDAVISAMCRDLTGELLIDANTEMNFADPMIEFNLLDDESWDEQQYKADDPTPMDAGSIIFKAKQLGFQRMICHVSEPFWFPDMDDMINNSLRVKTSLYCNRTRGIQNFIPVMPYVALFAIPLLWVPKQKRVLDELHDRLITLYREAYEINLNHDRKRIEQK